MRMSTDDQAAVQEALREVRVKAEACGQQPDTDATLAALGEAASSITQAMFTVRRAVDRARDAAEAKRAADLMARIERISA